MASILTYPPPSADAIVRGDPVTVVARFKIDGAEVDISTWTWRSQVRDTNGMLISDCLSFTVSTPAALPDLFPSSSSTVPCVLLVAWQPNDTKDWSQGMRSDIEQLTPNKRTWFIFDPLRVDDDVSYDATTP